MNVAASRALCTLMQLHHCWGSTNLPTKPLVMLRPLTSCSARCFLAVMSSAAATGATKSLFGGASMKMVPFNTMEGAKVFLEKCGAFLITIKLQNNRPKDTIKRFPKIFSEAEKMPKRR